jgi:Cu/Ag efflux protein CusF
MMPMVMPFKAEKSVDLRGFKAGDKVRFRVVKKVDHLIIEAMEMAK